MTLQGQLGPRGRVGQGGLRGRQGQQGQLIPWALGGLGGQQNLCVQQSPSGQVYQPGRLHLWGRRGLGDPWGRRLPCVHLRQGGQQGQ